MAITYDDKVDLVENEAPEVNKVTAANMNEIKSEVNKLAQGNDQTILTNTNATETVETYFCDATGGPFNLVLPEAPKDGKIYQCKKIDSTVNKITISAIGGKLIDFSATQELELQGENFTIRFYASNDQYYIL